MRREFLVPLLLLVAIPAFASPQDASAYVGKWVYQNQEIVISQGMTGLVVQLSIPKQAESLMTTNQQTAIVNAYCAGYVSDGVLFISLAGLKNTATVPCVLTADDKILFAGAMFEKEEDK